MNIAPGAGGRRGTVVVVTVPVYLPELGLRLMVH